MCTHVVKDVFVLGIKGYGEYVILVEDIIEKFILKYGVNVEPIGFDCFVMVTSNTRGLSSSWSTKTAVKYHFRDELTKSKFLLLL